MVFTRKHGGFHGRTVSFREGKMVNIPIPFGASGMRISFITTSNQPFVPGSFQLPMLGMFTHPTFNRESLFHWYMNPYGLELMSLSILSPINMEMSWEFTVDPTNHLSFQCLSPLRTTFFGNLASLSARALRNMAAMGPTKPRWNSVLLQFV